MHRRPEARNFREDTESTASRETKTKNQREVGRKGIHTSFPTYSKVRIVLVTDGHGIMVRGVIILERTSGWLVGWRVY